MKPELYSSPAAKLIPEEAHHQHESQDTPRERVTIAGNINEALDLLAEDVVLPALREGDLLALLNVGGYGSASSSNHCMRGQFAEYLLLEE
jgi:diaminopimelate decarboxylase